jgi:hypothetical protein
MSEGRSIILLSLMVLSLVFYGCLSYHSVCDQIACTEFMFLCLFQVSPTLSHISGYCSLLLHQPDAMAVSITVNSMNYNG